MRRERKRERKKIQVEIYPSLAGDKIEFFLMNAMPTTTVGGRERAAYPRHSHT